MSSKPFLNRGGQICRIISVKMSIPRLKMLVILFLIASTVAVYWQIKDHEFVSLDDHEYLLENSKVHTGVTLQGIRWAFTTTYAGNWHPLTWVSHMWDCQLYGLHPRGHHLTSLALHLANVLLLFLLLARITRALWPSAVVAALFALHPLHVESVAWVSERKDVLSTLFWLSTMWAYVWYVEGPGLGRYLLILLSFALGLMAKPMLVTLPFALLLLDYWPLGRFSLASGAVRGQGEAATSRQVALGLVWEKLPLLALAAVSALVTLYAQQAALAPLEAITPLSRIANALVAYVSYLGKMLWPLRLAAFYPHPGPALPGWQAAASGLLLLGLSYLAVRAGRKHPYLPVGWFWYLGTLFPVIGIVQVGDQALADRYTYIPLIGIFIILAWGATDLTARWLHRRVVLALGAAVALSACLVLTWFQVGYWHDTGVLFEHAKNVTADNYMADRSLIATYAHQGRFEEAVALFRQAIKIKPDSEHLYNNVGMAYSSQGKFEEATAMFQKALELKPNFAEAFNNLGKVLGNQGKLDAALAMFQKALELKPNFVEAYNNLGKAYANQGRIEEAAAMFQKAIQIRPDFAPSYSNLGIDYANRGEIEEAMAMFQKAIQVNPNFVEAYNNLGVAYASQGRIEEATAMFQKAIRVNPSFAPAYKNLGVSYANQGKVAEALAVLQKSIQINPGDAETQKILDILQTP